MKIFKKIKQNLTYILFLALVGTYGLLPKLVLAATDQATTNCTNFQSYFNGAFSWITSSNIKNFCTAGGLAIFAIQILINFSGVVAVLFLIVGGFFYLTSAGNEEQSEKGKKILINSVIGLVVIILASAIVRIIAGLITGGQ
jgi:hypothetical protein